MQKVKNWHFKIIKAFVVGDQVYAASGLKERTKKKKFTIIYSPELFSSDVWWQQTENGFNMKIWALKYKEHIYKDYWSSL